MEVVQRESIKLILLDIEMPVIKPVMKENLLAKVEELLSCKEKHKFDKKILVVDDDPQSLLLIKAFLKDKYEVITLSSGKTALF